MFFHYSIVQEREDQIYAVCFSKMEVSIKLSINRNKKVSCTVCGRCMRSDNLARHLTTHQDLLPLSEEVKEELRASHAVTMEREVKCQRIQELAQVKGLSIPEELSQPVRESLIEDIRTQLTKNNQIYLNKIDLGKQIADIVDEGEVREESMEKEHKEALDMYRKQRSSFDISDVKLRPWQQDVMKYFNAPSDRQVVWITGRNGLEGKSWFQRYVQSFFGYNRVVQLDLRIKHASICNVLKKRSLGTIDIFLFNDARSVYGEDLNLYRILEDIKDGQATASKYDNDNIRFKTPNTIIVFSNLYPNLNKLSHDRWIVLHPNEDGLKNVTSLVKGFRKKGYNSAGSNNKEQKNVFSNDFDD